ncbi:MAG: hypothetical protein AAGD25_02795 [Cyanobacteria bacterium P01_F01_bin.150]
MDYAIANPPYVMVILRQFREAIGANYRVPNLLGKDLSILDFRFWILEDW